METQVISKTAMFRQNLEVFLQSAIKQERERARKIQAIGFDPDKIEANLGVLVRLAGKNKNLYQLQFQSTSASEQNITITFIPQLFICDAWDDLRVEIRITGKGGEWNSDWVTINGAVKEIELDQRRLRISFQNNDLVDINVLQKGMPGKLKIEMPENIYTTNHTPCTRFRFLVKNVD